MPGECVKSANVKIPERRQRRLSSTFTINFKQILHIFTQCSDSSNVGFEQVNDDWEIEQVLL